MDRKQRREQYLAKMKEAEEAAKQATGHVREAWLKIAENYKALAKGLE